MENQTKSSTTIIKCTEMKILNEFTASTYCATQYYKKGWGERFVTEIDHL